MSHPRRYPPPTYHGESGEPSAWLRRSDTEPDIRYKSGGTCEYILTGDQSADRLGIYRWTFGEEESGPDPHFHRSISELFYVLSGNVRLYNGQDWVDASVGDYFHVPEGGIHAFKGADRASMLLMFAPGAPREDYFETLHRVGSGLREPMSEEERAEFMLRHDTFWV
jgi:quercetin dioxygenase-like cupin family protein